MRTGPSMQDAPLPDRPGLYAAGEASWDLLSGRTLVLLSDDGRKVGIELSRWGSQRVVSLVARFAGEGGDDGGPEVARDARAYCAFTVHPGGGDTFGLSVQAHSREDGAVLVGGAGAPWEFDTFLQLADGGLEPLARDAFLFHLGDRRFVRVRFHQEAPGPRCHIGVWVQTGPPVTSAQMEAFRAGGPLMTSEMRLAFASVNVLHVDASLPRAVRPIR